MARLIDRLLNLSGSPASLGVEQARSRLVSRLGSLSGPSATVGEPASSNPRLLARLTGLTGPAASLGVPDGSKRLAERLTGLTGPSATLGMTDGNSRLVERFKGLAGEPARIGEPQEAEHRLAGRLGNLGGEAARIGAPSESDRRLAGRFGKLDGKPVVADPVPAYKPMPISQRMAQLEALFQPRPAMPEEFRPFGEWRPDLPDLDNPGALIANGVVPLSAGTYGPMKSLSAYSGAITARCQGALAVLDNAGNVNIFGGDATKLYRLVSGTLVWEDVSTGAYTTGVDERWSFAQFGDRIIACNFTDDTQSYVIGTSTDFTDLAAAAPRARYVAVVRDFVVLANTFDGTDGNKPQRVWWSGINDPGGWPTPGTSAAQEVQSDFQDLVGPGGWIQGIVGGLVSADGVIIMEDQVVRMSYVGPDAVFAFDVVEGLQGTSMPSSIVQHGSEVFYISDHGFLRFDGRASRPIGAGKVDQYFLTNVDSSYLYRVWGAVDPGNDIIAWVWPGPGSSGGTPNKMLLHNFVTGWWAEADIETEIILPGRTFGYTLEGLDAVSTNIDTLPASLDSRLWTGGQVAFAAFDTAHKLAFFSGTNLAAAIETGEISGMGILLVVDGIRPLINGGSPMASVGHRATPQAAVSYTTATAVYEDGICKQHVQDRYVRGRVTLGAGQSWTHAQGIGVVIKKGDGR